MADWPTHKRKASLRKKNRKRLLKNLPVRKPKNDEG